MNKSVSFHVPLLIRLLQCSKLSSDKHETRKMSRFWKVRVVARGMNIIFLKGSSPAYSAKQMVSGDLRIFSSKRSFLLRKRMMEVSPNHLLLQIESNSFKLSCIRFWTNIRVNILQLNNDVHLFILPWSRPRAALDHTRTWPRRRWWRSHLQNSESISFSQISGLQHQTTCNYLIIINEY